MLVDVLTPEAGKLIDEAQITLNLQPAELLAAVKEMIDLEEAEEERLYAQIQKESGNPDYIIGLLLISATISLLGDGGVPDHQIVEALETPERHIAILNDLTKLKAVLDFLKQREDGSGAFERFVSEVGKKIQEAGKRLDQEMDIRLQDEAKRVNAEIENLRHATELNQERNLVVEGKMIELNKKLLLLTSKIEKKTGRSPLELSEYLIGALLVFASTSTAIHITVASPFASKLLTLLAVFIVALLIFFYKHIAKKNERTR